MDNYTTVIEQGDFMLLDVVNFCVEHEIKITIGKIVDYRERKLEITLEGYANDLEEYRNYFE